MPEQRSLKEAAKSGAKTAKPKLGKPEVVETIHILAQCGHMAPFEVFADAKDKYREQRAKKIINRPCSACRQKIHEERMAHEAAEAAKRKAAMRPKPRRVELGRLPHGAVFHMVFDAGTEAVEPHWTGYLRIEAELGPAMFEAQAGGVVPLLRRLDTQYREFVGKVNEPRET